MSYFISMSQLLLHFLESKLFFIFLCTLLERVYVNVKYEIKSFSLKGFYSFHKSGLSKIFLHIIFNYVHYLYIISYI